MHRGTSNINIPRFTWFLINFDFDFSNFVFLEENMSNFVTPKTKLFNKNTHN